MRLSECSQCADCYGLRDKRDGKSPERSRVSFFTSNLLTSMQSGRTFSSFRKSPRSHVAVNNSDWSEYCPCQVIRSVNKLGWDKIGRVAVGQRTDGGTVSPPFKRSSQLPLYDDLASPYTISITVDPTISLTITKKKHRPRQ